MASSNCSLGLNKNRSPASGDVGDDFKDPVMGIGKVSGRTRHLRRSVYGSPISGAPPGLKSLIKFKTDTRSSGKLSR